MSNYFDDLIREGRDTDAMRLFAREYYEEGKMGHTRLRLLIRVADKLDKYEDSETKEQLSKGKIVDYDKMPLRGKETSDGEKTKNHGISCGGRCYVHYDENRWYRVECEKCGNIVKFKSDSLDLAIKIWNDMPDVIGY